MKRTYVRRLSAAVIAPVLAFSVVAGTTQSAQAAPSPQATVDVLNWLAAQPDSNGHLFESVYGTGTDEHFTDYGLNLDIYAALDTLGDTAAADDVYQATIAHAADYTDGFGKSSGAIAKLAVNVQRHDKTSAAVIGEDDLISDLKQLVITTDVDGEQGLVTTGSDFVNTFTQSFAVRALATAGSDLDDDATAYLLKQQCSDGSFRESMAATACTAGTPSIDSTASAVQALEVAKDAGVTGLQDDIDDAAGYLVDTQASDGSFADAGATNSNSTGLAALALKLTGHDAAAENAADWVIGRQLTTGADRGAIAHDSAAKSAGISTLTRDSFVRATVQAIVGFDALPDTTFTVTRPSGYAQAGSKVVISASGLIPDEIGSIGSFTKKAGVTGKVALGYTAPATTGSYVATVNGATGGRHGSVTVKVLAAKTFTPTVKFSSVARGGKQRVAVSGLAAGEPVRVGYGGKTVASSKASSTGTYAVVISVGSTKGVQDVSVVGAFSNRRGLTSFTVK